MDSATGKVGKVSWVASALPHSEGAAYKRQGREVAACLRGWRMGSEYATMDRDNRTRTGAKDPWGRAAPPPLAQRLAEARLGPDTEPDQHVVGKRAKGRYKQRAEAVMPGAGLTAEAFG